MKTIPIEREEQIKLVQWLRANRIFHFAPTNENNTYKQNRKFAMIAEQKAKATGKIKGVSDLVVMLDDCILFIELKRQKKILKNGNESTSHISVSKEQIDFCETVSKFKYARSKICYGADEAIEFIESFL